MVQLPENAHNFHCLMATSKEVRNIAVQLVPDNLIQVVQILEKFGGKVKKFYLKSAGKFRVDEIQTLFSLVPNASDVRFYANLTSHLILGCDLLKFPGDCLEEAELSSLKQPSISYQTKIKKLSLVTRLVMNPKIKTALDHLQVEDLTFKSRYWDEYLPSGISSVTVESLALKHLCLKDVITDKELAGIVQRFPNLQTFSFEGFALTSNGIKVISELKQLVELKIDGYKSDQKIFKTLAGMDLSRLYKLSIFVHDIDEEDIKKLSQNTPNIQELIINCEQEETLQAVLREFRQVKSLSFFEEYEHSCEYSYDAFFKADAPNTNLKQLNLGELYLCSLKEGMNIVKAFPNLERIDFYEKDIGEPRGIAVLLLFRLMLKKWENLTHLKWRCFSSHDVIESDLELILDHGQKLRFVLIGKFKKLNVQKVRRMLGEKFGIILFKNSDLIMARDLRTFREECTIEDWFKYSRFVGWSIFQYLQAQKLKASHTEPI